MGNNNAITPAAPRTNLVVRLDTNDDDDSRELMKLVKDDGELFQILHRAVTFNCTMVYLVIGDQRRVMIIIQVMMCERLMKAYREVLKCIFSNSQVMKCAHDSTTDEEEAVEIPNIIFKAFKTKKLKHVRMTEDSFRCFMGLWRKLYLETEDYLRHGSGDKSGSKIAFPLIGTARLVPMNVASWNGWKPGGDTLTEHIDYCHERVGVRTENNVATARIFEYFAMVDHKYNQMISASEDLDNYPTLRHYRDAANHRFSTKDSFEKFYDTLLK